MMTEGEGRSSEDPSERAFTIHALEFHWDGFDPHLVCYDMAEQRVCEFDLGLVDFSVSRRRVCIGYWDDDGKYVLCPRQNAVSRFAQCAECSEESFLPYQDCLFEPRCDGEICDLEFCKREHLLYVAFYDTRMKIGMSSTGRVERRLIEQGADAYCVVGKFPTRKRAREAEKDISRRLRMPQFHRHDVQLRNLSRPVDIRGIEGRHEALRMTLGESYHLSLGPLKWLDRYPIDLPLQKTPALVASPGSHKGALVGIKGKWMVFESEGLNALNLSDLPARYLARHIA